MLHFFDNSNANVAYGRANQELSSDKISWLGLGKAKFDVKYLGPVLFSGKFGVWDG